MPADDTRQPMALICFMVYEQDEVTILVQHPCEVHDAQHTDRLALGSQPGTLVVEDLWRLLMVLRFTDRCEHIDDLVDLAESVRRTVRDL